MRFLPTSKKSSVPFLRGRRLAAASPLGGGVSPPGGAAKRIARRQKRSVPFQPFQLCLADGRRVPVKHPEFVAMNQRIVIVTDEESETKTIEPLLIVSLEPLAGGEERGSLG